MTIVQNEGPICWKFVVPNEAATGHEEVVLSVQGIISQKDLPPVMIRYAVNTRHLGSITYKVHSPDDRKRPFIRQSVQLTGLNIAAFKTCSQSLQAMHLLLSRQIPEGFMDMYLPSTFLEYSAIDLGTRYFTTRREDPHGAAVPFSDVVDPRGLLSSMATDTYFHGTDNEVLYYSLSSDKHNGQVVWHARVYQVHLNRT